MDSPRRPRGLLQETILGVMIKGMPLRAVAILNRVHRAGELASHSLFFRDLRKLVDAGSILRLNVARSYMLAPAEPRVLLYCAKCGSVTEARADPAFERIAQLAQQRGFRATHTACESTGVCHACRPRTAAEGDKIAAPKRRERVGAATRSRPVKPGVIATTRVETSSIALQTGEI